MTHKRTEVPDALVDLPPRSRATFYADRDAMLARRPELAALVRRAGDQYLAAGWRMHRDAVSGKERRRRPPSSTDA